MLLDTVEDRPGIFLYRGRLTLGAVNSPSSQSAKLYLAEHNTNPKPFVWTKTAEVILAKLDRLPVSSVCV